MIHSLIAQFSEMGDGSPVIVEQPLDALAGQSISLVVLVFSSPGVGDDGIYFGGGRIVRPG